MKPYCTYCHRLLNVGRALKRKDRNRGLDFTIDHMTPLCRGGPDTHANRVPSCFRCNNLKADMTATEFRNYIIRFGFDRQPARVRRLMKCS